MISSDPPCIDTAISDSQLYPLKRGLMILKTDLRAAGVHLNRVNLSGPSLYCIAGQLVNKAETQ